MCMYIWIYYWKMWYCTSQSVTREVGICMSMAGSSHLHVYGGRFTSACLCAFVSFSHIQCNVCLVLVSSCMYVYDVHTHRNSFKAHDYFSFDYLHNVFSLVISAFTFYAQKVGHDLPEMQVLLMHVCAHTHTHMHIQTHTHTHTHTGQQGQKWKLETCGITALGEILEPAPSSQISIAGNPQQVFIYIHT